MLTRRPRTFSRELKEGAVLRLQAGESYSALATELGVRRKLLYDWSKAYRRDGIAGFNRKRGPKPGGKAASLHSKREATGDPLSQAHARIAELERLVGRQQVDLDFFRKALRLSGMEEASSIARTSTRSSKQ